MEPEPLSVEAKSTALLIVDMQNDFVDPKGALYGEASAAIIPNIRSLLERARDKGMPVVYTQDWHLPNDKEFRLWPRHCVKGTWGAEMTKALEPRAGEHVVRKGTIDPWFRSTLATWTSRVKAKTLIVTGTVANICVLHAVAGAVVRGLKVVVPEDCIAPLAPADKALALHQFKSVYGCSITSSESLSISP